jgi:hypothetical protein
MDQFGEPFQPFQPVQPTQLVRSEQLAKLRSLENSLGISIVRPIDINQTDLHELELRCHHYQRQLDIIKQKRMVQDMITCGLYLNTLIEEKYNINILTSLAEDFRKFCECRNQTETECEINNKN